MLIFLVVGDYICFLVLFLLFLFIFIFLFFFAVLEVVVVVFCCCCCCFLLFFGFFGGSCICGFYDLKFISWGVGGVGGGLKINFGFFWLSI